MATLIPSMGSCVSRMTSGERRLAERLEQKLDSDYCLWYDVPMGPKNTHPDFCVMHPRRGILVLEVKDWKTGSTILQADKQNWEIMGDNGPKTVISDIHQRIGGEIHPKQVKRTLEELTATGSVRFEGDKRWRRYWAVQQ